MKKLLSVILIIVMLLQTVAFAAPGAVGVTDVPFEESFVAETEYVAELEAVSDACGKDLTWTIDENGTLTISGTGDMYIWDELNLAPWFSSRENIKSVVIGDGVTNIGEYAFFYCTSLESIEIPDSVTSLGANAFRGCWGLTSVEIPDSVRIIGKDAFYSCEDLEKIIIGKGVTIIDEGAFAYCDNLIDVKIPDSITSIFFNTFIGCTSLTSVEIGNSVTNIGDAAFRDCSSLTSVVIPDSVTSIGSYAFSGCYSLTSVEIGDSVTSIGKNAFSGCNSLTSVVIPDSVTSIGEYAFESCESLTSVVIPDSVTSLGNYVFGVCINLESVVIGNSVTSIGSGAFATCVSLTSVVIPDSVTSIDTFSFGCCSRLEKIVIPASVTEIHAGAFTDTDNVTIHGYADTYAQSYANSNGIPFVVLEAEEEETRTVVDSGSCGKSLTWNFYDDGTLEIDGTGEMNNWTSKKSPWYDYCEDIWSVKIGDGVTTIGNYAFYYCDSLESIIIPASVTSIASNAFNKKYTYATIYGFKGSYAEKYADKNGFTFSSLEEELTAIASGKCGDNITWSLYDGGTLVVSGTGAMYDWVSEEEAPWHHAYKESIKTVIVSDGVTYLGKRAFRHCNITNAIIPNSVTVIGASAFEGCEKLTEFEISNSVTNIGEEAFYYCRSLKNIEIPDSVTNIGDSAFQGCTSLESIEIPDSVTSIGDSAFNNCQSLKEITIPSKVESIGSDAFAGCDKLEIHGYSKSYANTYAIENGIPFVSLDVQSEGTCGENLTWILYKDGLLKISGTGDMDNWKSTSVPWRNYREDVTSIEISDGVTSIGDFAFSGCAYLTSVKISGSVTSIGNYAFESCGNLASITIPDGVTRIGNYAFSESNLTSVKISDSVTSIGNYAFYYCYGLESVTIPDSVTSIGNSAFRLCGYLEHIDIPASVTSIASNAFAECDYVTFYCYSNSYAHMFAFLNDIPYVCVDNEGDETNSALFYGSCGENLTWEFYENGLLKISGTGNMYDYSRSDVDDDEEYEEEYEEDEDGSEDIIRVPWHSLIKKIVSVEICDGVTGIGDYAFSDCYNLESVVIGNGVTSIGDYAFYYCDSLTSVEIGDSVTSIGELAFYDCNSLTSVVISDSVTSIGERAFYSCDSLAIVVIGNGVTSIGSSAFYSCDSLTSIVIPDSVTNIGQKAFYNCSNLESVNLGNGLISIGDSAFFNCNSLKSIEIPDSVKSIGTYAFEYCKSLKSVEIPASVVNIGGGAFSYCTNLEKITVDENNRDYSNDANGVLYNKNKTYLIQYPAGNSSTSYEIPDSVISIVEHSFDSCKKLEKLVVTGSVTTIGSKVFTGCPELTIYGHRNSYIKVHANNNNIPFVAIDEEFVSVTGVSLNKTELLLEVGEAESLVAKVSPVNATNHNVRWKSSDTSVVTVENGLVTAVGEGTATITVTTSDGYETATCTVTVTKQGSLNPDAKATVALSDEYARAGETISVIVSLSTEELVNTIGVSGITFDSDVLTFAGFTQYDEVKEITVLDSYDDNKMAVVIALNEPQTFNGRLFAINFVVNENAVDGKNVIDVSSLVKFNDTEIVVNDIVGSVTIVSEALGDISRDEVFDVNDAILLLQHSMFPDLYPIEYKGSLDFTKDGVVDMNDAVLLLQHSLFPDLYPI